VSQSRLEKERDFHNRAFANRTRQSANAFYSVLHASRLCFEGRIFSSVVGARVLEFGCGKGAYSIALAKRGALVTGIDISDVAVDLAAQQAKAEGVGIEYRQMDAEAMEFPSGTFDLVSGVAILHHLDLDKAYSGIARVLRPGGRAVFLEPLGHNPAINLYRRLTPQLRTEDEHPLLMRDLHVADKYFSGVENRFFTCQSLFAVPFRRMPFFMPLLQGLEAADRILFAACPPARRLAWQVVIALSQPREVTSG
jgi:SAM-dependent methyltransferase